MAEYVCPKCTEKLKREARHKAGSNIYNEHLKYKQPTKTQGHDEILAGNKALMPEEFVIDESEAIPEDLIQDLMNNQAGLEASERDGKSVFLITKNDFSLDTIPPNAIYVQTKEGMMQVVRDETGKAVGTFDPEWTLEKVNFRTESWGYYVPNPKEPESRQFIKRPFTDIEKLKYAQSISEAKHRKYTWFQRIADARKLKELLLVKKDAKHN